MDAEDCEQFTDVYWIKFRSVSNARSLCYACFILCLALAFKGKIFQLNGFSIPGSRRENWMSTFSLATG